MELVCYEVEPGRVGVRPAPRRRRWMDDTPGAYAYRCLPLTAANEHGWELLCPVGFEAVWNGGPDAGDVRVTVDPGSGGVATRSSVTFVESHFGAGTVTFNPLLIVRTPPGYNVWVAGPTNAFKHGIGACSATIETDWMPFTFSMNWKLTAPNVPVRFEVGEPFCLFFPVERGVVTRCEPVLANLADDPELAASYEWAMARRNLDAALGSGKDKFQGWYTRGEPPDRPGVEVPGHQSAIGPKPFTRRR